MIGQVHEKTAPALKILQREGFTLSGMVDIFDAGPIVRCPLEEIQTVKQSAGATVGEITDREIAAETFIISNCRWDFRACTGPLDLKREGGVRIGRAIASALEVRVGDTVRFAPLYPPTRAQEPEA